MSLRVLREDIDRGAAQLEYPRQCKLGCKDCCVDALTVFEIEAEEIRRHHPEVLASAPHPPGACAFLSAEGACRIYAHRPYVCRTQGLPLRWTDEDVEYRDICPLNDDPSRPIEALAPEECWTLGPVEARLAALQPDGARIALRALFVQAS